MLQPTQLPAQSLASLKVLGLQDQEQFCDIFEKVRELISGGDMAFEKRLALQCLLSN